MRDEYSALVDRHHQPRRATSGDFAEVDPAMTALQLFGMCNWSWTWFRPEGAWSAEDIAETFTRVIFNGLGNGTTIELSADLPDVVRTTIAEHAEAPVATG